MSPNAKETEMDKKGRFTFTYFTRKFSLEHPQR